MKYDPVKQWGKAALIRSLRTFAQTAAAAIGAAALISEVNWFEVLSAAAMAAILSLLMSVGGLPEAEGITLYGTD